METVTARHVAAYDLVYFVEVVDQRCVMFAWFFAERSQAIQWVQSQDCPQNYLISVDDTPMLRVTNYACVDSFFRIGKNVTSQLFDAETEHRKIREAALAKLTVREREALGL